MKSKEGLSNGPEKKDELKSILLTIVKNHTEILLNFAWIKIIYTILYYLCQLEWTYKKAKNLIFANFTNINILKKIKKIPEISGTIFKLNKLNKHISIQFAIFNVINNIIIIINKTYLLYPI